MPVTDFGLRNAELSGVAAGGVDGGKSGSRRRAVAVLWRAAKAEGLPQSKTLRVHGRRWSMRQLVNCARGLAQFTIVYTSIMWLRMA